MCICRFCASFLFSLLIVDCEVINGFCAATRVILAFSFFSHTFYTILDVHGCVSELFVCHSVFTNWQGSLISFCSKPCTFYSRCQFNFLYSTIHVVVQFCYNCTGGTIRFLCNTCLALIRHFSRFVSDSFPLPFPVLLVSKGKRIRL